MAYITFQPSDYFKALTYTGNGSTQSITGVGFQPDWCWIKGRGSSAYDHQLFDVVRGVTKAIASNDTAAESTFSNSLTSFDSDGFSLGDFARTNSNGDNKVSWNWRAGNSQGSSNTDGTINTTYTSANTTSGFSISTWTGTGSSGTIGHGLGAVPKMLIIKSTSNTQAWMVYHVGTGNNSEGQLNATGAFSGSSTAWQDTDPTSSVFYVSGSAGDSVNASGYTYVGYAFAEKKGFSKFGVYTGNGVSDGAFVYTGFKPAFLLVKEASQSGESWIMFDNARSASNLTDDVLFANANQQEEANQTSKGIDFLSNGFKIRSTDAVLNDGEKYIFMAFAEEPLVASNGTPATAR